MRASTAILSVLGLAGLSASAPAENQKRAEPTSLIKKVPLEPSLHVEGLIKDPKKIKLTAEDLAAFAELAANVTVLAPSPKLVEQANRRRLTDTRHVQSSTDYPYSAVGRLYITDGTSAWICTASLLSARIISTASHCMYDMPSGTSWTFQPDYFNGNRYASTQVNTIAAINWGPVTGCAWKNDWAIMALNDPVGNDHGWFGSYVYDDSTRNNPMYNTAGYPGDIGNTNELVSEESFAAINVECDNLAGAIDFAADAAGGQSGSPIWFQGLGIPDMYQSAVLVGITSAYSVAAWGQDWFNTVNSMIQAHP